MPSAAVPTVPFPLGMPVCARGFGLFRCTPGWLPVTLLFRDWDLLWLVGGRLGLRYPGRLSLQAGPGDLVIIPPFQAVEVSELAGGLAYWFCHTTFTAPGDGIPDFAGHLTDYRGPGEGRLLPLVIPAKQAATAITSFRAMSRMAAASRRWEWQRHVLDLFAALAAICPSGSTAPTAGGLGQPDPRIGRLLLRIDAEPAHPWTVAGLARLCGLGTSQFNALFRRQCGCGPKRYLVEARLRLALRQLREAETGAERTILAASRAAGFSSQHLFARQFRARFGITPTAYRDAGGLAT